MECKSCSEDVEELFVVKVDGKRKKVCEECSDRLHEEGEIAEAAESAMQGMMEYKGRR